MAAVGFLIVMAGLGLFVGLAGLPLAAGRVGRNPWYGFRTPKTLVTDEAWYPANRYAGRALAASGGVTTVLCLFALPFAWMLPLTLVQWMGLAFVIVPLGYAVIRCFVYLSRL